MKSALRSEKEKGQRHMSSMDEVFLILILAGGFWKTETISVEGELDGDVRITCSHNNAYRNVKYFCKAPCRDEDVLIKSSKEITGRYSIIDEGSTFYVTISRLTEGDAGKYWCGIERVAFDTFKEVVLTVIKGKTKDPEDDFSQSTRGEAFTTNATGPTFTTNAKPRPTSTTNAAGPSLSTNEAGPNKSESGGKLVYIGAGLGGAVLALAVVLLIFFKHQKKEISNTSGTQENTDYASPSSLSGNGHNSRDQSDDLFYTTVDFNTPADCRGVPRRAAEFDSENDDIAKEVRSMMRLSDKMSGAHRPKQDPSTSVYTEVEYSHLISVRTSAAPEVLQSQDIQVQMSSAPLQRSAAYLYHP